MVLLGTLAAKPQQPAQRRWLDRADSLGNNHASQYKQQLKDRKGQLLASGPLAHLNDSAGRSSKFNLSDVAIGSGMQRIGGAYRAVYSVEGQLSLFQIPIHLQLGNQQRTSLLDNPLRGYLFKFGFDREALLKSMVPELDGYQQLRERTLNGRAATTVLREQLMAKLQQEAKGSSQFSTVYQYLNQYGNVEALLKLDDQALRQKLQGLVAQQRDTAIDRGSAEAAAKLQQARQLEGQLVDSLALGVAGMQQLLRSHGIVPERIADIERQVQNGQSDLSGYMAKYRANNLGHEGWKGLLNRLGQMDMGSFGQQLPGSFMNRDLFLQGGAISLQTSKGPLQLGLASHQDIGLAKDAGFTHSNFNIPKLLTFISVPVMGHGYARARVSWTGSIEKQSYRLNESAGISPRSGSSLTLSQELGSEKMGRFTMELSKSAASFRNVGALGSEHILLERNTFGNYFRDDLFETMAFGLKYDISRPQSALQGNAFFSYSGIGYQSPGQQGFGNMGMRWGGAMRKGLLKNRLQLNLRGDFKQTPVSGTSDAHWQNHNLNVEARVKLSRKVNLSFRYMDNGVSKSAEQVQTGIYSSRKYQLTTSGSYKLFKKSGFSHLVLGLQDMNNPANQTGNQFLTAIYAQNLVLGDVVLTGNFFYNREMGSVKLMGDMLNADAGLQYKLLDKLGAATSLTYLNNTGQVRQAGLRQNLQFSLWKNLEANVYADVRRNMVEPLYPELFASNRGEVSLKYYFR